MASSGTPQGYSKACCTAPRAIVGPYIPKGEYITIAGLKTYVTGPLDPTSPSSRKALLSIFDIFAFSPQTLQGADILAAGLDCVVLVPDLFNGHPGAQPSWFVPMDNPWGMEERKKFFGEVANKEIVVPRIKSVMREFEERFGNREWSVVGYCWGGKIVAGFCGAEEGMGGGFKCAVQTSPAFLDLEDAKSVKVPMAVLASGDEDGGKVQEYGGLLPQGSMVEVFGGMIHGWMSARGNLNDEKVKKEYERGYQVALEFLKANA